MLHILLIRTTKAQNLYICLRKEIKPGHQGHLRLGELSKGTFFHVVISEDRASSLYFVNQTYKTSHPCHVSSNGSKNLSPTLRSS